MTNEQVEFITKYMRIKTLDRWGELSEENETQASERRKIEAELGMSAQETYEEAVRQVIARIAVPPTISLQERTL